LRHTCSRGAICDGIEKDRGDRQVPLAAPTLTVDPLHVRGGLVLLMGGIAVPIGHDWWLAGDCELIHSDMIDFGVGMSAGCGPCIPA
jgi:hypothetical protein